MNFPNYTPTTRSYSTGFQPTTKHIAISGYETRVVTGSQITQKRLQLEFANLTPEQANAIEDHYFNRRGEAYTFSLSSNTLAGGGSMAADLSADTWRYAAPVNTSQSVNGRINVSVQLVSVF